VSGKITATVGTTRDDELASRCAATPADAEIRAIFLHAVDHGFARETGRSVATHGRPRGYSMVPVRSYLEEVHALAASLGPTAEAGLARIHTHVGAFLLGHPGARLFLTDRDRDPMVLLGRLERSRSLMASYGEWRVSGTRGDLAITVRNEWVWLDAMWSTVIASMFPACGLPPAHLETILDSPFSGTIRVRW